MALYLLEFCYPFMRYAMFFFNLVFWILGVILFGFSIWALADPDITKYTGAENSEKWSWVVTHIQGAAILVLLVSLATIAIGFLGCCGAIKESKWMLAVFFIALFIIFAVLLACGIAVLYRRDMLTNAVGQEFYREIEEYRTTKMEPAGGILSMTQKTLSCCGMTSSSCKDYLPVAPPSTCKRSGATSDTNLITEEYICNKSCLDAFNDYFGQNMHVFGAVVLTIAVILIFGMMFSLCIICGIREFQMNAA